MKTIRVSEATNTQLDWLVAKCEGATSIRFDGEFWRVESDYEEYLGNLDYTADWSQMGPIIERETISVMHRHRPPLHPEGDSWNAVILSSNKRGWYGPTPLIAAARCYVVSKLGETVEVPEELT